MIDTFYNCTDGMKKFLNRDLLKQTSSNLLALRKPLKRNGYSSVLHRTTPQADKM
ncbi:hypothetical protein [Celerinatantimonas diazotrophica]|uniref:hypothetical protein n=1 Tax=Celerinatantimonas diazotrophica TaxID=412034 RepID=UPI001404BBF6|nr:hypothetical protein [Celerinatantimonas diazotrophica]